MTKESFNTKINTLLEERDSPCLLALEGPCASGKTTFGKELGFPCVSMDDFFLSPEKRSDDIGGNIDKERFLNQVLLPLSMGKEVKYAPYLCHSGEYGAEITLPPSPLLVVEGVYSLLPQFRDFYQMKVFLSASWEERKKRLLARGGEELLTQFEKEWIPRENRYFQTYQVKESCDFFFETDGVERFIEQNK
ncbi:MAG: uridine kinase [Eubacteriales bacterium]